MKSEVWLYSQLEDLTVKSTHLKPVKDIGKLVDQLVHSYGPSARICVLPEGPHTIPYLK